MLKKLATLLTLGLAAAASIGCSTVTGSFMQRRPNRADQSVVEAQVCRGDVAAAIAYMEDAGMPRPDRTAALERARDAVKGRKDCPCAQQQLCSIEKEEVHAQP
jgi:hypothetical protein